MTAVMTAQQAYTAVKSKVESIVNDKPQSLHTMEERDEWRQGDVRIVRLPDNFDMKNLKKLAKVPTQLAPGDTMGSRHTLDSVEGITAYELVGATAVDGPVLHVTGERRINHPEHGDCCNLPAGLYAFPGQRSHAEELRRTRD